ncbi:MAG TPA: Uma2 family endonuclease [Bryobacteraceae bacterium]
MRTVATLVSEEEYLKTAYEPDCEYEDGVLIERNAGEEKHSWLQGALIAYFFRRRKLWNMEVYPEQRNRIRQAKYMLPDLCVIRGPRPAEGIFNNPPLIWIEILSPEDRPIRVNEKVRQVLEFGAPNVWVIDPETLECEAHTPAGRRMVEDGILRVEGTPIEVPLHGLEED